MFFGELQRYFRKTLTELYPQKQYLSDFNQQLMACMRINLFTYTLLLLLELLLLLFLATALLF